MSTPKARRCAPRAYSTLCTRCPRPTEGAPQQTDLTYVKDSRKLELESDCERIDLIKCLLSPKSPTPALAPPAASVYIHWPVSAPANGRGRGVHDSRYAGAQAYYAAPSPTQPTRQRAKAPLATGHPRRRAGHERASRIETHGAAVAVDAERQPVRAACEKL
ncbi:hypothetical protein HYPSUDRAFT_206023 [Hypholoma sublateritium FD-334 SS-4]|uniref:Uncharacterized protein n=1 Tax=Hypholoma sublateritium (strain FD-334 SS-4) TaxID=945553 RepID=A0A0D2NFF5_HYPSF|nr:hypothetical protein HYPSUDRAFT_206023 [Hypholoma sublateritium FD-334 SS-4]